VPPTRSERALSGYLANPASNIKISCQGHYSNSGIIKFTLPAASKDSGSVRGGYSMARGKSSGLFVQVEQLVAGRRFHGQHTSSVLGHSGGRERSFRDGQMPAFLVRPARRWARLAKAYRQQDFAGDDGRMAATGALFFFFLGDYLM